MKKKTVTPTINKPVYILPNLFTTGNLFFGYFSILKSMDGDFVVAAAAILLASIFDVLDGRVARLTNAASAFGVQYDSLCDLVSFGVAPAILVYQYSLGGLGRIAWAICFMYVVCGALRLARFNVQSHLGDEVDGFVGIPIPAPAGLLSTFVAFMEGLKTHENEGLLWLVDFAYKWDLFTTGTKYFLLFLVPLLAFLMVSNILYRSHKSLNIKGIKTFHLLALLGVLVGLLAYKPSLIGFLFFLIYAFSGVFEYLMGWQQPVDDEHIFETSYEDP